MFVTPARAGVKSKRRAFALSFPPWEEWQRLWPLPCADRGTRRIMGSRWFDDCSTVLSRHSSPRLRMAHMRRQQTFRVMIWRLSSTLLKTTAVGQAAKP